MINEKPLKYVGISGIAFPILLLMMFPEGTAIYSIANILLTLFSGFLFIVFILSACGQKEVLKVEQSYEIPFFEAFASNFGDECAIVWKKTNELVEIHGNDGKLTYTDAHHILNDYLKQNPDKIWGVQIVPRAEIVTPIYPVEETDLKSLINEVEEVSTIEADEDQTKADEIKEISPIKEIDVFPIEDVEEILPAEDIEVGVYNEADEDIFPVDETEEISTEYDTEPVSVEEDIETIIETEVIEEISTLDDTDYLVTAKELEEIEQIKEIDELAVEVSEEIFHVEDVDQIISSEETKDFFPMDKTEEISVWGDSETISVEEDTEIRVKTELVEDISSMENTDVLDITDSTEDLISIEETVDSQAEQHEDISAIVYKEDLEEVSLEKDTEAKAKGELLSNIPDPYIILSRTEERLTTNGLDEVPLEKDTAAKAKGELLSNISNPYIILSNTEDVSSAKVTEDLPPIEEISTTKDLTEIPPEKDTETKAKRELLSNIPDPYIILSRSEELDKTNDNYKLKVDSEEE